MHKLQTRLIFSFTLVILVTLCGVSTIFSLLIIRLPQQERLAYLELNTQARSIITVLQRFPNINRDRISGFNILQEYAKRQDQRIAWATSDFLITFDSANHWKDIAAFNTYAKMKRNPGNIWTGQVREGGNLWIVVAHPTIGLQDNQNYLILAKTVTRPLRTTLSQLRETVGLPLLQAGGIALAIGIALSITISHSIARPLSNVSQAALKLADGQYDTRVQTSGPQEIKDLGEVFNEMAQQIQASQEAQNDLVANIAHDLRTPLTSIQGYAQALVDGTAVDPQTRDQAARVIVDESRRMQNMTKTLLDLAKIQAGDIKISRTTVNVAQITSERIEFYRQQITEAGLILEYESTNQTINTQADRGRLIQVLDNLITNAIAYTLPGGKITVATILEDTWVKIIISDTGVGIPPEDLPRIYERFYRGDKSRQGSGTGLGLSIVKEIIHAHGGSIHVESIVGVGSKFTVRLPR
ncbi:MAG: HAMP domain-containing sensor histidine kinase [Anaerolineae bacterium]|nr:HAMP domain-containing sensor histidine kinase [Anaerolineae bacterium]